MSRRLFGAVAAAGAMLVSWVAMGQPRSSSAPAVVQPANRMAPVFQPGIAPAPRGSAGKYELRHLRSRALFTDRGVELSLPSRIQESRALGWSVAGGRPVSPRAEKPREAKLHRLVGPAKSWEREMPTYGGLRYPGVLPGVDLWFEERAEGVEYGFRAERGADLRRVELEYAGAREVRVVEEGRALEVDLGEGVLREQGLHCAQERPDGSSKAVGCRFTDARPVDGERWAYAIEVDVEDPERPVVVDPLVLWNTYLGGPDNEAALWAIQQNDAGDIFIGGTIGVPAPAVPRGGGSVIGVGAASGAGRSDAIVARFQPDGVLIWWTIFGGDGADGATSLVLGESDEVYVAGFTRSTGFEWRLPDGSLGGSSPKATDDPGDGFVARLDSSGKKLDWFERIDWGGQDIINDLIWGPNGRLFIAGATVEKRIVDGVEPYDEEEAFISRLDPGRRQKDWDLRMRGPGNGEGDESVRSLTLKDEGSLYATGSYSDFPGGVTNAFVSLIPGINEVSPPTSVSNVPIGGSGSELGAFLTRRTGGTGNEVLVWGTTIGNVFPPNVQINGGSDIFVSVVEDIGGNLALKGTKLLGGAGFDELFALETDSSGRIYLGGFTTSPDLGVGAEGGFDTTLDDTGSNPPGDGFVARVRLEPEPAFEWVSYVGGDGMDNVLALHVDDQNPDHLFIGGFTSSSNLQYSNAGFDPSVNGPGYDNLFLLAVDLSPGSPQPEPEPDPLSPLGWSCGATGSGGGWGVLALGVLVGLVPWALRRGRRAWH